MLFSEIYSAYYTAVAHLISCAIDGELSGKNASEIISQTAFSESFIYILENIKNENIKKSSKSNKTQKEFFKVTKETNLAQRGI